MEGRCYAWIRTGHMWGDARYASFAVGCCVSPLPHSRKPRAAQIGGVVSSALGVRLRGAAVIPPSTQVSASSLSAPGDATTLPMSVIATMPVVKFEVDDRLSQMECAAGDSHVCFLHCC